MSIQSYSLSGNWTLVKEADHVGKPLASSIPTGEHYGVPVPYRYEQKKWKYDYAYSRAVSRYHGYVWFYRYFNAPSEIGEDERCLLEFDRVSYFCQIYINGTYVGEHRHSEERFSLDITDVLERGKKNLLAVRCFEPVCGGDAIDGIRLDLIPNGFWAGSESSPNLFPLDSDGGILEDVRITVVPKIRILDVFILPDHRTGKVDLKITLFNATDTEEEVGISVRFSDTKTGGTVTTVRESTVAKVGESSLALSAYIPEWRLWEIACPVLYTAEIVTDNGASKSLRFGFKEFLIKDGFFFLNGRRILLKCAHGTPSAETVIEMKAMGFNAFRSIQHLMPEEVLDLCDEIGFMIIEAPLSSWGMRMHEMSGEMIRSSLDNMVRLHRNHVSIGAFYLFNELKRQDILHLGSEHLPTLRALAPNILFLLSSGRWDLEYGLGSVSNPYSEKWECLLGNEGTDHEVERAYPSRFLTMANLGMGDLHPYPYLPMDSAAKKWFRTVGCDNGSKPVFISECGIGTHEHTARCLFDRLELGMAESGDSIKEIRAVDKAFEQFLTHYGMENVFPFVSELCRAADRENGRQRQMLFDLIRSNPMVNGFSLTSWGCGNEGTLEGVGVIKESVAYAMQEGWAPLRWALFTSERVLYAHRSFRIEAVLSNEDVLPSGAYKAEAKIKGYDGIVWKKDFVAKYPKDGYGSMPPLAATVLSEEIMLPKGEYTLSVRLLEGGCPFGGTIRFTVVEPDGKSASEFGNISTLGLSDKTVGILEKYGIKTTPYTEGETCGTLFVGAPADMVESQWERLMGLIEHGTKVVFLNPEIFNSELALTYLRRIAGDDAKCAPVKDWLYHYDTIHIRHPLFAGMHDEGLLELDAFFELYPRFAFLKTKKADLTVAASFRVDAGSCTTSLSIGEYKLGDGIAVLSGFRIEEALGINPYAEQMLFNFISNYSR